MNFYKDFFKQILAVAKGYDFPQYITDSNGNEIEVSFYTVLEKIKHLIDNDSLSEIDFLIEVQRILDKH